MRQLPVSDSDVGDFMMVKDLRSSEQNHYVSDFLVMLVNFSTY